MAYRIFRDSAGMEWQTWDVVPRLADRRMRERRVQSLAKPRIERRRAVDRRVLVGRRPMLGAGLDCGWLCFQAPLGKRRLSPIPSDWMSCAAAQLEQYCHAATPAAHPAQINLRNLP